MYSIKKQKMLLKPAESVNKIAIKKEVRVGKPQPNKVVKSIPRKHSDIKRIKSINEAGKLSVTNNK